MKPSPYFADQFRFFFKRFSGNEALFKWFLKKAGEDSQAFDFPGALKNNPKTLVFLPRDMESAAGFLHKMPNTWFANVLCVAHESLHALISAKRAHAIYFSDSECRYGERVFDELEQKIHEFSPTVCIYLGQPFLPRLYLAKSSGAGLRIGFNCEAYYPFLNMSLTPDQLSEAELISGYYGVGK
ncbi:MAG: hypothetical protein IJ734_04860 [Fibrobacter sp.]|mgnify:FL=1|uniref:hypothetical protein n=1 Tax=Fibrobacter sp. UWR3 TaxID=1896217 RepID=UPI00091A8EE7|nr:hypothetical protein [Fibrobacter sp. UWR3]MBO6135305.1 hypothetical protein [Fibrobacter sp.]MBR1745299.1 hypothetical protein [Fibrobacter sp.]SHM79596.1 hypothetical protein SAMN05720472_2258 [Fibrobacter sp. UWR3]